MSQENARVLECIEPPTVSITLLLRDTVLIILQVIEELEIQPVVCAAVLPNLAP